MSEELKTDSNTCEVLDPFVNNVTVCDSDNDANSSKTPENAIRAAAAETDLQYQRLPITVETMDTSIELLTADFEHAESDNTLGNFNTKDSGVSEASQSSIMDHPSSVLVDDTSSSSQSDRFSEHVNDSSSATSLMQRDGCKHQTLPVTMEMMDTTSKPLTADFQHVKSNNVSDNFSTKDSSVGEASESIIPDYLSNSSSQLHDLPQCVNDTDSPTCSLQQDGCDDQLTVSVSSRQQCSGDVGQLQASVSSALDISGGGEKSGNMIQSTDHHKIVSKSDGMVRPSTIVVISTHENKDSSMSCQKASESSIMDHPSSVLVDDTSSSSQSHKFPEYVNDSSLATSLLQQDGCKHQTLPVTMEMMDTTSKPLTVDFQHVRSNNLSYNSSTKDSSVSEGSESSIVDYLCNFVSQLHDLPQCVNDTDSPTHSLQRDGCDDQLTASVSSHQQCNSDVGQLQASISSALDISGGGEKSGNMIQSTDHHKIVSKSDDTVRPSTIVVISAHENKDSSMSCQTDLDCAGSGMNKNAVDSVPQSAADLRMCGSDDDTLSGTETYGDLQAYKHSENADGPCARLLNEIARIADHAYTKKEKKRKKRKDFTNINKQQMASNGMTFLH